MIRIIPSVKTLEIQNGYLEKRAIFCNHISGCERLKTALSKLPQSGEGARLDIQIAGDTGDEYELWIK